ncbi:MAG: hypothetical protein ACOX1G_09230 [bacterium]|nr:hypothetical protein [bacterium]
MERGRATTLSRALIIGIILLTIIIGSVATDTLHLISLTSQPLRISKGYTCTVCNSIGFLECKTCNGLGYIIRSKKRFTCPVCDGKGFIWCPNRAYHHPEELMASDKKTR